MNSKILGNNKIFNLQKTVHFCTVFWFISLLMIFSNHLYAQEKEDSVNYILPDLIVEQGGRSPLRIGDDGSIKIKSVDVTRLLRSFGEIDFLNQIKQTSQIYSSSDYSSGLSIDGNDGSQAQYLIGGAPVIFPYRFGGIFSTFNTPHFSSMVFSRLSSVSLTDRLGASFEFLPAYRYEPGAEGAGNIGMTSSSLTVRGGIANRVSIGISGRASYINQIYGRLLAGSRSYLKYNFYDLNADVGVRITDSDHLQASFFTSADKVGYDDKNYSLKTVIHWDNTLYNIAYSHEGSIEMQANMFRSSFHNVLRLNMPQFQLRGPSSFATNGLNFNIGQGDRDDLISQWESGLKISYDQSCPQWAVLNMAAGGSSADRSSTTVIQRMCYIAMFGKFSIWLVPDRLKLKGETSVGIFTSKMKSSTDTYRHVIFTPNLHFLLYLNEGVVALSAGWQQQPIHQVGFSELGLASNFWIGAYDLSPVQHSFSVTGRFSYRLPWWDLKMEAKAYWKKLRNQAEYRGEVMEVIDTYYDPFLHLIISDGYNYGISVGLSRQFGKITGDVSYSYGDGLRHLPSQPDKLWHALNSEGNAVRCNFAWHEGNHWLLSASWRMASGRRYTPVEALYAIGGNIAMEYGERNSARLPSYQRLDLGASYYFMTGRRVRLRHSINLSILNAYGHKNVEMQYFILDSEEGKYSLKRLYSLYRFLPSLSYSIEF